MSKSLFACALATAVCASACLNMGTAPTPGQSDGGLNAIGASGEPIVADSTAALQPNTVATNPNVTQNNNIPSPGPTPGNNTPSPEPEPVMVTGADRFTLVGRYITNPPGMLSMSWLSSKIGLRFTGTSLAMDFSSSGVNRLNIVLDGNPLDMQMINVQSNTARKTLVEGLVNGTHTIWITKGTEFTYGAGVINISDFCLDEGAYFLTPPKAKSRRIEAIGDSSYSSYGVEGVGPGCNTEPKLENADHAIPAFVAQNLDAELVNLSATGRGVVESQFDSNRDPNALLPYVYKHWIGGRFSPLWDFNKVMMDVVLLSAGGNDLLGDSGNGALTDPNKFISTYAQWMLDIRTYYPKASIYAIMSPNAKNNDRITMMNALKAAVAQAQSQRPGGQDSNMLFYDYFANDPNGWTVYDDVANKGGYGWGCSYHTNVAGSRWLGDRLAASIKSHMNW